jgi:hypothetical protein
VSIWSTLEGHAKLGDVISHLESLPADMVVEHGFGDPHSYRGYYEDLSFEPIDNTTVGEMLAHARSAVGKTFTGYKGGDYVMDLDTDCWLAECGSTGIPIVLPGEFAVYELPRGEEP